MGSLSHYVLFALSNPCVILESSLFMISKATWTVCAVDSMHRLWKQFVDDFRVPRACLRCPIHASPVEAVC
jgi:hypothetical protein